MELCLRLHGSYVYPSILEASISMNGPLFATFSPCFSDFGFLFLFFFFSRTISNPNP